MMSEDNPMIYTVTYDGELPLAKSITVRVYGLPDYEDFIANPLSLSIRSFKIDEGREAKGESVAEPLVA